MVQELSYDAWGRLRNPLTNVVYSPDSEPSPFLNRGYTGHEHLTAFGLIHMNARAYDPAVGRFLSPDPYVADPNFTQAYNRYSYCMNNPLVYTDPDGEFFLPAVMIIAGIAGGSMNVISNWDNIQKNPWSSLTYFASGAVGGAVAVVNPFVGGTITATANVATDLAFGNMPHIQDARDVLKYAGLKALDGIGVAGTAQLTKAGFNVMTKWGWIDNVSGSGTFHYVTPSLGMNGGMEGMEISVSASKVPVGLSVVEGTAKGTVKELSDQIHHFATNKNKLYTPQMEGIAKQFGLDLNGAWNKTAMPHLGRHPNVYHDFVLKEMKNAENLAGGSQAEFLNIFNQKVKQPVIQNPGLLRKLGW